MASRKVLFVLVALVATLAAGVAHSENSFVFSGSERTYLLHVPSSYDGRTSRPLIIMLHGSTQTAEGAQAFSGFSEKSDQEGFIVVYPQGAIFHFGIKDWNIKQFAHYAPADAPDDVGFVNELISRLEQEYKIDPKRIYIAGFSAGAHMTYLLGAELSYRIAAIAPVAGSVGSRADNEIYYIPEPSQPLSVISFCGTVDFTYLGFAVPRDSPKAKTLSVAESIAFWVRCDGCSPTPQNETSSDGKVTKTVYTGGKNGTEVVSYTLVNVGHVWPASPPYIAATDIIWDFFKSHPKQ
jgi:polyhydroxybutyrate depolymerase